MSTAPKRVYLKEVALQLDRRENTIRLWERPILRDGKVIGPAPLPKDLHAYRDEKGWRYWTPGQVTRIKAWLRREGRAPGSGLKNGRPSLEQTQKMLATLRQPRPERRTRTS